MENELFEKILKHAEKIPYNEDVFNDLISLEKKALAENREQGLEMGKKIKSALWQKVRYGGDFFKDAYRHIQRVLIAETPYSLDSYFQALEWKREKTKRFYSPRRKKLLKIVNALERMAITDELDELFLSQPARTGKTALMNFFISWVIGMYPELTNLYCSYSGSITGTFFKGVQEIISDNITYCWQEIFPNVDYNKNTMCNAKDTYLDTGRIKKYHSITCRSIDASLNGTCDCNGYAIGDDLISGIQEALNPEILKGRWDKVNNDFITRKLECGKLIWIGTRWSVADPIGKRLEILQNSPEYASVRYEVINIPALDENDKSNFDYDYNLGFSTAYYKQRRASFELTGDLASWDAQFQGEPVERSGLVFPPEIFRYFDGQLPTDKNGDLLEPTRKFAPVDVAFGGGDFLSMPIIYQYENDFYVVDWIFDNSDKKITQPRVVDAVIKHGLSALCFEANNGGESYGEKVVELLAKKGYKINTQSKYAPSNKAKELRIYDHKPDIVDSFVFLSATCSKRNYDYSKAMVNLHSFSMTASKQHDDAPDSLSQACEMAKLNNLNKARAISRPF